MASVKLSLVEICGIAIWSLKMSFSGIALYYKVTVGRVEGSEIDFVCDRRGENSMSRLPICLPQRNPLPTHGFEAYDNIRDNSRNMLFLWMSLIWAETESSIVIFGNSFWCRCRTEDRRQSHVRLPPVLLKRFYRCMEAARFLILMRILLRCSSVIMPFA